MENKFGIKVGDGSIPLPNIVAQENKNFLELHDWQRRAIQYFFLSENNYQAIYVATTGVGKTFCAIQILKEVWKIEPKVRCLIVVPKNVILERGWYKELWDAGISIADIGIYYGNIKECGRITLTNMQNINKIALDTYDMIIFDEIHNYGTKRLLKYVKYPFKYKIGLTATIERMDDAHYNLFEIFNYNVFYYTPQEALDEDVLNSFKFINIGVVLDSDTEEVYLNLTQEINSILVSGGGFKRIMFKTSGIKNKMLAKMNERKQLVNNYYKKFNVAKLICDKHKDDKVIIFNQYNEQTNKLYWNLLDMGVNARIVHSGVKQEQRERNLTDFKNNKYNILLTTKCLDEGYNLPKIDVGIIMAGDSTPKQTIQRMGRVLRKKNKESNLYQIFCVNTIEESQGLIRAKLFKQLSTDYKDIIYTEGEVLNLWED